MTSMVLVLDIIFCMLCVFSLDLVYCFFFKQKTAYEMRISDWSSDVCSSDLILCEHNRIIDRSHQKPGQTIYDWRHYLAVVQRKPGALRNGAPFLEMPEAFRLLQGHLRKRLGGDREMFEILARVLQHHEQAVPSAVELALEAGLATKTHIDRKSVVE